MKTELPQAVDTPPEAPPTLQPLLQLTTVELSRWLKDRGFQPWYSKAIRRWVLFKRATTFEQMSDLPKQLRTQLTEHFIPLKSTPAKSLQAHDGTRKLLLKMWDGEDIECVMIPDYDRRTACISTQVGCGMGCVFCASGLNGVMRNLEPGEILEQLVLLRNLLPAEERLSHIVVMGMGEPLANLDSLLTALEDATAKDGLGIGARHITISTVGLPVKIRRLAESGKQYSLAVSLHAPNEELRNKIVPTNDKTGLQNIMQAADDYFKRTGRQVTFEYVVLRDINDRPLEADQLSTLLKGRGAHVNLIPFNEVDGLPYRRPTDERLNRFVEILRENGINVHVRKRKGSEISAACGQLRRQAKLESGSPLPTGKRGEGDPQLSSPVL